MSNNEQSTEEKEKKDLFEYVDKAVLTLYNEPSLGLYYTQQHIEKTIPKMICRMDALYDNRKKVQNILLDVDNTIRDLKEMTSLNDNFSYKMLAIINSLNYEIKKRKEKK